MSDTGLDNIMRTAGINEDGDRVVDDGSLETKSARGNVSGGSL